MENVKEIAEGLIKSGLKVTSQKEIDDFLIDLDKTDNKGRLGANAILGVSIAVAEAGAAEKVRNTLYRLAKCACSSAVCSIIYIF